MILAVATVAVIGFGLLVASGSKEDKVYLFDELRTILHFTIRYSLNLSSYMNMLI